MKKVKISSELLYIMAILVMSFSVAMITTTDFGLSMIVSPAYIISEKIPFLTFGQGEYIVQGILFLILCVLMKKVKLVYFSAFITGVLYGACLDIWMIIIPHFNPDKYVPGTLPFPIKIVYFVFGMCLTSLGVAMFFKTYIYPQVYDFFVKAVSVKYNLDRTKFKICFDFTFLIISFALTFILFGRLVGVGIGTIIMTCFNGLLIGIFGKILNKYVEVVPMFKIIAQKFEID